MGWQLRFTQHTKVVTFNLTTFCSSDLLLAHTHNPGLGGHGSESWRHDTLDSGNELEFEAAFAGWEGANTARLILQPPKGPGRLGGPQGHGPWWAQLQLFDYLQIPQNSNFIHSIKPLYGGCNRLCSKRDVTAGQSVKHVFDHAF